MYEPSPDAIYTVGESLTEQEHAADCDINRMMDRARRGLPISGVTSELAYGDDDLTLDLMGVKLQKQALEVKLGEMARTADFTEEEVLRLPKWLRDKFGFKAKVKTTGVNDSVATNNKPTVDPNALSPNVDGHSKAVKPDGAPSSATPRIG